MIWIFCMNWLIIVSKFTVCILVLLNMVDPHKPFCYSLDLSLWLCMSHQSINHAQWVSKVKVNSGNHPTSEMTVCSYNANVHVLLTHLSDHIWYILYLWKKIKLLVVLRNLTFFAVNVGYWLENAKNRTVWFNHINWLKLT